MQWGLRTKSVYKNVLILFTCCVECLGDFALSLFKSVLILFTCCVECPGDFLLSLYIRTFVYCLPAVLDAVGTLH